MARPVRTVKIMGHRLRFRRVPYLGGDGQTRTLGTTDAPGTPGRAIRVKSGLSDAEEMETVLHELIHAAHWSLDEEHVEELALDLSRVLRRLGFRKA